jgi:hypothetical protein
MNRRTQPEIGRDMSPAEIVDETRRTRRSVAVSPRAQSVRPSAPLRRTLGARHTLRQAMLLKEILGPPTALRRPQDMG